MSNNIDISSNIINEINNVLTKNHLKNVFLRKSSCFGIKGTSKYDDKDLIRSLKNFVLEAPYNKSLYEDFVDIGLLPKFFIGDLVHWYKEYPPKDNFEVNSNRVDVIENIGTHLLGGFSYFTREYNISSNIEPRIGKASESYIVKCGIDKI